MIFLLPWLFSIQDPHIQAAMNYEKTGQDESAIAHYRKITSEKSVPSIEKLFAEMKIYHWENIHSPNRNPDSFTPTSSYAEAGQIYEEIESDIPMTTLWWLTLRKKWNDQSNLASVLSKSKLTSIDRKKVMFMLGIGFYLQRKPDQALWYLNEACRDQTVGSIDERYLCDLTRLASSKILRGLRLHHQSEDNLAKIKRNSPFIFHATSELVSLQIEQYRWSQAIATSSGILTQTRALQKESGPLRRFPQLRLKALFDRALALRMNQEPAAAQATFIEIIENVNSILQSLDQSNAMLSVSDPTQTLYGFSNNRDHFWTKTIQRIGSSNDRSSQSSAFLANLGLRILGEWNHQSHQGVLRNLARISVDSRIEMDTILWNNHFKLSSLLHELRRQRDQLPQSAQEHIREVRQ